MLSWRERQVAELLSDVVQPLEDLAADADVAPSTVSNAIRNLRLAGVRVWVGYDGLERGAAILDMPSRTRLRGILRPSVD